MSIGIAPTDWVPSIVKAISLFLHSLDNFNKSINPPSVQWQLGTEIKAV